MALNHESLMEQLANCMNQLSHIRKQLQKEVDASNKPTDAVLREENAALRAELESTRLASVPQPKAPLMVETEPLEERAPVRQQVAAPAVKK